MTKNNKGITMITLIVTILVISIIAGVTIYQSVENIKARKIDLLYADLELLEDKVNTYYLNNGGLPIKEEFKGSENFKTVKNVNDNDVYYVIDISSLDGVSLNMKLDFTGDDVYIMNEQTHTVYYPKGLTIDNETYYTLPKQYSKVEDSKPSAGGDDNNVSSGDGDGSEKDIIEKTNSYVGYYADIDDDGIVDGIIYADLAIGGSGEIGSFGRGKYVINKIDNVKDYYISQREYQGVFGTKDVLSPISDGEDRFYVMQLENAGVSVNWWGCIELMHFSGVSAYISLTNNSLNFGTGRKNTEEILSAWEKEKCGMKLENDLWSFMRHYYDNGWFVPSSGEWAAFVDQLSINGYNLSDYFDYYFWTSSVLDYSWILSIHYDLDFYGESPTSNYNVRLSITF